MSSYTFFDRDISWLKFNERVLDEAAAGHVPLLERIKFLSIYSSNLDEFYRVRMPALLALRKINKEVSDTAVYARAEAMINEQQARYGNILSGTILPALESMGIRFLYDKEPPAEILPYLSHYFYTQVAGFLQSVNLSAATDFFPENNQLYMIVSVLNERGKEELYLLNIPTANLPRFYTVLQPEARYIVFIEDIIRLQLHRLFPLVTVTGSYNIKITRDAELNLKDEYDEDLAERISKQLMKRDQGYATRFLYEPGLPLRHRHTIIRLFNLQKASVVEGGKHHNLKDLMSFPLEDHTLTYPAWPPAESAFAYLPDETLFSRVAVKDIMVHAPYQSYDTIIRFFNEAAIDPCVTEIYTTLYRVASESRIGHALISAARNGKTVTVLVELKARFDEANNIRWAQRMKAAGVRIIYSSNSLKVHAKIALVKRDHREQPYLGLLATGNLNESTARFYTDHILLTARSEMLAEMESLFTFLGKRKKPEPSDYIDFRHLLVARFNLLPAFLQMIDREIMYAQQGLPAAITIKINNLEEKTLISKLYEASGAGVSIRLIVRGICRLVPGVPGQSEHIEVKRIVDRYLEHGRVFIFHNNGNEEVYMGSADWMNRNIHHRIEVCGPVYDDTCKQELIDIVNLQWQDNQQAVCIDQHLEHVKVEGDTPLRSQEAVYNYLLSKEI